MAGALLRLGIAGQLHHIRYLHLGFRVTSRENGVFLATHAHEVYSAVGSLVEPVLQSASALEVAQLLFTVLTEAGRKVRTQSSGYGWACDDSEGAARRFRMTGDDVPLPHPWCSENFGELEPFMRLVERYGERGALDNMQI